MGLYTFALPVRSNFVTMMRLIVLIQLFILASCQATGRKERNKDVDIRSIYHESKLDSVLKFDVFDLAMAGMHKISGIQNKRIITIIDFSKPSTEERFFVIDLVNKKILHKTLVAHGKNSGENKAESFSNAPKSQE